MSNSGTEYLNGYDFSGIVCMDTSGKDLRYIAEITKSNSPSPIGVAYISKDLVRRHHLERGNKIEGKLHIISPYPARVVIISSVNGVSKISI